MSSSTADCAPEGRLNVPDSPKTYVTFDCVHQHMRPGFIMFGCDEAYYVKKLAWSYWWAQKAHGRGVFHINDCDPNCAQGTFHLRSGQVTLAGRRWCKAHPKYLFKQATVVYDKPYQGQTTSSFSAYYCPPT